MYEEWFPVLSRPVCISDLPITWLTAAAFIILYDVAFCLNFFDTLRIGNCLANQTVIFFFLFQGLKTKQQQKKKILTQRHEH